MTLGINDVDGLQLGCKVGAFDSDGKTLGVLLGLNEDEGTEVGCELGVADCDG